MPGPELPASHYSAPKNALTDMTSGQVLKILATDPGSIKDFQAFSKQTGNELLSSDTVEKEFIFFMKRK